MKKFFTYDPTGDGLELHDSPEGAESHCQKLLDRILSDYDEDDITFLCWGEIRGQVVMKNKREPTEEERTAFGWDYVADVVLEDV